MKKTTTNNIRWLRLLPLTLLSAAMLFTGCGASKSSYMTEATAAYDAKGAYHTGDGGFMMEEMAAETAAASPMEMAPASPESGHISSGITQNTTSDTQLPLERKLIRNITLNVETLTFDDLVTAVQNKTTALGGYIEQSDISGNSITSQGRPAKKYASMVLRIPSDQLNAFVTQVETDGNVTYKSETVSDVTLQYSDLESRLKTLRMEQERLWELLAKAESTESIIALEQRLTEVSTEIETSESRIRHFDNSVTYSTVYLNINEVDLESPTEPETAGQQIRRGFMKNLDALMTGLSALMIGILSGSPIILFLALIGAIVFLAARKIHRKKQTRQEFFSSWEIQDVAEAQEPMTEEQDQDQS